jgi:hypothetical protein
MLPRSMFLLIGQMSCPPETTLICARIALQMVILEYCGGGNLHKALQKDAKAKDRRLVRPSNDVVLGL